jgi:acyl-CoA thioester hydrolase
LTENLHTGEIDYRVTYADTDKMGVVYYSNYLMFFEKGRTELMRQMGLRYKDMEDIDKVYLPVSEATIKFVSPAHYDDLLKIRTTIAKLGSASINFEYEVVHPETGKTIVQGMTRHPFVDKTWKPVRIPDLIKKRLGVK